VTGNAFFIEYGFYFGIKINPAFSRVYDKDDQRNNNQNGYPEDFLGEYIHDGPIVILKLARIAKPKAIDRVFCCASALTLRSSSQLQKIWNTA